MGIISNNNVIISGGSTGSFKELGYFKRKGMGSRGDYYKAVVPLINVDNSQIDRFSYTSGRLEMIRFNGCCYKGVILIDFKMQKEYNTENYHWTNIHVTSAGANPCKFTYNGQKWAGMHLYYTVQSYSLYFQGFSTEALDITLTTYQDVRDNSIVNSEIYNSLVIGTA